MNIGQLDGQPLALQIFNGMTAESICVNERWAKDQLFRCVCFAGGQIKSTPSIAWRTLCFNLRPPCGGRLCTGGALYCVGVTFQSTSSAWRTTHPAALSLGPEPISIHVLRVEDDRGKFRKGQKKRYFNPRPPCGGRHRRDYTATVPTAFQSTSSVWRTTECRCFSSKSKKISIHVLRVEDDAFSAPRLYWTPYFNPRPPCGGRRYMEITCKAPDLFQSTSSVWRTTVAPPVQLVPCAHFNPRPPCGGRLQIQQRKRQKRNYFNPRPPCGGRRNTKNRKEDTR